MSATLGQPTDGAGPGSAAASDSTDPPKPPEPTTASGSTGGTSSPTDPSDGLTLGSSEVTGNGGSEVSGDPACPSVQGACGILEGPCPGDQRCRPYDQDGDSVPDAFGCFESPGVTGEGACDNLCGRFGGSDTCIAQQLCDPFDEDPICVPLCLVDGGCAVGTCETEGLPGNNVGLCRAECDPFLQDCPDGQSCTLIPDGLICASSEAEASPGAECSVPEDCSEGLACAPSPKASLCEGVPCCATICSVEEQDCPKDYACHRYFPEESTSNTDVGVCIQDV